MARILYIGNTTQEVLSIGEPTGAQYTAIMSGASDILTIPPCCVPCETPVITRDLYVGDTVIPFVSNMPDGTEVTLVGGVLNGLIFNGAGMITVPALEVGDVVQIRVSNIGCSAYSEELTVKELPENCESCEASTCNIRVKDIQVDVVNGIYAQITKLDVQTDTKLNYKIDGGAWKNSWAEIGSFEIGADHKLKIKSVKNPACSVTLPIEIGTTYNKIFVTAPTTPNTGGGTSGTTVYTMNNCVGGTTLVNMNFQGMLGQIVRTNLGACGTIVGTTIGTTDHSIANIKFDNCGHCAGANNVQNYVYSIGNCTGGTTFVNTNFPATVGTIIRTNYGVCGVVNGLVTGTAVQDVANIEFLDCATCTGTAIPTPPTNPTDTPVVIPGTQLPATDPIPGCTSPTAVTISPTSNPTVGSTVTYTASPNSGSQNFKNWTVTGGTILSGQGTLSVTIQWGSSTIFLGAGVSCAVGCSNNDYQIGVGVYTLQAAGGGLCINPTSATISPNTYPVKQTEVTYTLSTGGGSTNYINWSAVEGTIISGQGTSTVRVLWNNNTALLAASLSVFVGCSGTSNIFGINLFTLQEGSAAPTSDTTCVQFVNSTGFPVSMTYKEVGDSVPTAHTIGNGVTRVCAVFSTIPNVYGVDITYLGTPCTSNGAC